MAARAWWICRATPGRHGVLARSASAFGAMRVATPVVLVMAPFVDGVVALRLATSGATCVGPAAAACGALVVAMGVARERGPTGGI